MSESTQEFQAWDYVVFVAVLVLSAAIGLIFAFTGGRQKTTKEYLMANRQMGVLPVAVSMVVTIISAITLVGTPGEVYTYNTEIWLLAVGGSLGYILTTVFFIPLLFPLKLTSAYEYLELRFDSKAAKYTGTFLTLTNSILYMGIVMYTPATALEQVSGSPVWLTMLIVCFVSTLYTALGGIKAVLWVDTLQSVVMIGGLIAIIIEGAIKVGGLGQVFHIGNSFNRVEFLDFDPDPLERHTFWTIVIGSMIDITARTAVYQAGFQRYCSVPTIGKSKIATLMNIPFLFMFWTSACVAGLTMFAYYAQKGCDPLAAKYVKNPNQLITHFLVDILGYPGVPGLFVGSIFSAVLSTTSSIQSAAAAVTYEDVIKPHVRRLSENKKTWITKALVVLYGVIGLGVAFAAQNLGGTVIQIGIAFVGASVGPLLGMFILGGIFPWANWKGAVVGGLVGLCFPMFLSIGAFVYWPPVNYLPTSGVQNCTQSNSSELYNITSVATTALMNVTTTIHTEPGARESWKNLFRMSYQYNGCIGMSTAVIVGLIVSFITGHTKKSDVNAKYLIPFFDRLSCGRLPKSLTRKLQCNIPFDTDKDCIYEKAETKESTEV